MYVNATRRRIIPFKCKMQSPLSLIHTSANYTNYKFRISHTGTHTISSYSILAPRLYNSSHTSLTYSHKQIKNNSVTSRFRSCAQRYTRTVCNKIKRNEIQASHFVQILGVENDIIKFKHIC